MEESSSSSCSDGKATGSRFTPKQKAILSAYFNAGMRGVGELYASRIDCVAREAGLQVDQVKNWIKKKNFVKRHAKDADGTKPAAKKQKLTPWQVFMQDFGRTKEGKEMMKVGTKEFTQAASSEYKSITVDEKEKLRQRCEGTSKELTARKIKLEGRRIFKSISLKIQELQELGYSAFVFGFYEEDVHLVGTEDSRIYSHPTIFQFLTALVTASNPPSVENVLSEFLSEERSQREGKPDLSSVEKCGPGKRRVARPRPVASSEEDISVEKGRIHPPSVKVVRPLISAEKATSDQKQDSSLTSKSTSKEHTTVLLSLLGSTTGSSSSADYATGTSDCEYQQYSSNDNKSLSSADPHAGTSDDANGQQCSSHDSECLCSAAPTSDDQQQSLLDTTQIYAVECSSHSPSDKPIVVSSSPVKKEQNNWLKHLHLTFSDKLVLQSSRWSKRTITPCENIQTPKTWHDALCP